MGFFIRFVFVFVLFSFAYMIHFSKDTQRAISSVEFNGQNYGLEDVSHGSKY